MTNILLIDNNPEYLKEALEYHKCKVSVLTDLNTILNFLECEQVDIIILNVIMPYINGFKMLEQIRNASSLPIIITTSLKDEDKMVEGLRNGADDYIIKPYSIQNLLARIEAILRRTNPETSRYCKNNINKLLTKREADVLKLAAMGENNKNIGQKLFLSEVTIKSHMNNIFKKLNVKNRTQAVLLYKQI